MTQDISFGELIQRLRREKDWTVREFIKKLGEKISPAYMTKIEVHGEIPKPDLICKIADVFKYDANELLECAKQHKVKKFSNTLEERYGKAYGLYRSQKKKNG